MALILCPECGREISDAAAACPNCGFPLDRLKKADVQVVRTVTPAAPAGETILVRRRGFALAAAIFGTFALIICAAFMIGNGLTPSEETGIGGLMYGQVVFLVIGVVCNWVGFFSRTRVLVLVAAICYVTAIVFFIIFGLFLCVVPTALAFAGYSRMKPERMTVEEYLAD